VLAALEKTQAPIGLWSQDFSAAGNSIAFGRNSELDVYGVVLKGTVTVEESQGKTDRKISAGQWVAVHAPGAGVKLTAEGGAARMVLVLVGGPGPVGDAVKAFKSPKAKWQKRAAAISSVDLAKAQDLSWAGGAMHARTAFEGSGQRASLGVMMASKDAEVPRHKHDGTWEMVAVLAGDGTALKAEQPGDGPLSGKPVSAGSILAFPKDVDHAFQGSGKETTVALQIYAPPGPEQRFKKLAADAK
jgi:quercetin dioxygenase-like cupin family protein